MTNTVTVLIKDIYKQAEKQKSKIFAGMDSEDIAVYALEFLKSNLGNLIDEREEDEEQDEEYYKAVVQSSPLGNE